jgi:hypothetical protein
MEKNPVKSMICGVFVFFDQQTDYQILSGHLNEAIAKSSVADTQVPHCGAQTKSRQLKRSSVSKRTTQVASRSVEATDGIPLQTVTHVTHIRSALSIIESGKIRAQRIVSDSELTKVCSRVVWLSPNAWAESVYGNVQFILDFKRLITERYCYLVEQPSFKTQTYRFLITNKKHGNITLYRPTGPTDPWWQDQTTDRYLHKLGITIQFVIDRDIKVDDLVRMEFVSHAHTNCVISGDRICESGKWLPQQGGARFFAAAVANAVDVSTAQHMLMVNGRFTAHAQGALDHLYGNIKQRSSCKGTVKFEDSTAVPLARAILSEFGRGRDEDCLALASLFKSKRDLKSAIDVVLAAQIGVSNLRDVAFKWDEEG